MSPQNARYNCSIDAAMSVIEGRWKGTIICMLYMDGTLRFSELQKKIGEITSRILSKQLKELESDGMVTRTVVPDGKVKVEYSLTDKGRSIIPVLTSLAEWGAKHQCIQVIVPQHDMVSYFTDFDCNAPSAGPVELAKEYSLPGAED